jgi:hypothetical protein
VIPRDEVATHWVEVPVDWRTIPRVPEALAPSKNPPLRAKLPLTLSLWEGVEDPMPTLPLAKTEKRFVADDVATLKTIDVPFAVVDATLKETVVDVAPTPATVLSSKKRPVERVVGDVHRARYPKRPPPSEPDIPNVDVATHLVVVPVD